MRSRLQRLFYAAGGYPAAIVAVAVATLLLLAVRPMLSPLTVVLLYVPVIVGLARVLGVGPSAVGSVLAFLALDFLFMPPYYTIAVRSPAEWIGLVVFVVVALVAGQQTALLRRRQQAAVRRQVELELLNDLSFRVAASSSPAEVASFVVDRVTGALGAQRAALYVNPADAHVARCIASAGRPTPSSGEEALVRWVLREGKAIGLPPPIEGGPVPSVSAAEALPGVPTEGMYVPLLTADSLEGVLHAVMPTDGVADSADPALLVAVANLSAASIERQRLEEEAAHATALREADKLKSTLVSSVSHELKTPLAAATARVTGLVDEAVVAPSRLKAELAEVADDLERLNASIGDLLDLSRLESDAWRPHQELYEVGEVLGTVAARLRVEQRRRVHFSLAETAPAVSADFAQLARAFFNLVENALAYSPPGESVLVTSAVEGGEVLVTVEDRGPGVAEGEKERVFEKFFRGAASGQAPGGTGLGLAIAYEIVRSHGGRLYVEDAEPHGARFVVALPHDGRAEAGR